MSDISPEALPYRTRILELKRAGFSLRHVSARVAARPRNLARLQPFADRWSLQNEYVAGSVQVKPGNDATRINWGPAICVWWCGPFHPKMTRAQIDSMRERGISSLRVPVLTPNLRPW
jgi:hypothetical protein